MFTARVVSCLATLFVILCLLPHVATADEEVCHRSADVVQLQDATSSFKPFWSTLINQAASVIKSLKKLGSSTRFGIATFGDKNLTGVEKSSGKAHVLGREKDYCLRVDAPLDAPHQDGIVKIFSKLRKVAYPGGGDWPENVFEAIYRSVQTAKLDWGNKNTTKTSKLLVAVTDAISHLAGDGHGLTGKTLRPFDSDVGKGKDENQDCDKVEYPTVKQLVDALKEQDTELALLVAPGGKFVGKNKFRPYKSIAVKGDKYRKSNGLSLWYKDELIKNGKPNPLVYRLDPDMKNYAEVFNQAIEDFSKMRCGKKTSTDEKLKPKKGAKKPPKKGGKKPLKKDEKKPLKKGEKKAPKKNEKVKPNKDEEDEYEDE